MDHFDATKLACKAYVRIFGIDIDDDDDVTSDTYDCYTEIFKESYESGGEDAVKAKEAEFRDHYYDRLIKDNEMYSKKEKLLITQMGFRDLIDNPNFPAPSMYELMIREAFLGKVEGPLADSLRRCWLEISEHSIRRRTPEWDALIELE